MRGQVLNLDRHECPCPNVQRHPRQADTRRRQTCQQLVREVQPGRRRRNRTRTLRVHRLIPLRIGRVRSAVPCTSATDIRRQRRLPKPGQPIKRRDSRLRPHEPFPPFQALADHEPHIATGTDQAFSDLQPCGRLEQHAPGIAILMKKQPLDPAAARPLDKEPRRQYPACRSTPGSHRRPRTRRRRGTRDARFVR